MPYVEVVVDREWHYIQLIATALCEHRQLDYTDVLRLIGD
jgi:hypothetical protein